MFEDFKIDLCQKKQQNLYRKIDSPEALLDFTSNDYLNFSQDSQIRDEIISSLKKGMPLSASASPLLGGISSWHFTAEKMFQDFVSRPAALSFSSGCQANLGLLPALSKKRVIFSDELNHASLIDGIRLSRRPYHIFKHNDLNHLEDLMKKSSEPKLIVTESLFSMSGDFSDVEQISQLALKYKALLFLDEAHSTGLFGKNASGLAGQLKEKEHIITLHTGGKALAGSGAFIACSNLIKEYLINNCRSFIYSTAPSPIIMSQWTAVLRVLKRESYRAGVLAEKALQARKALGLPQTKSPILFINLKSAEKALKASQLLKKHSCFAPAIRYPTVPKENQGLRLTLRFCHTKEQLNHVIKLIENFL